MESDPELYSKEKWLLMGQYDSLLKEAVECVLERSKQAGAVFLGGKERAFGFLVGQTMKELKGKADPGKVNALVKEALQNRIR